MASLPGRSPFGSAAWAAAVPGLRPLRSPWARHGRNGPGTAAGRQQRPRRGGARWGDVSPARPMAAARRALADRCIWRGRRAASPSASSTWPPASPTRWARARGRPALGRAGRGTGRCGGAGCRSAAAGAGAREVQDPGAGGGERGETVPCASPALLRESRRTSPSRTGLPLEWESPWHSSPPTIPLCSLNCGSGAGFVLLSVWQLYPSTTNEFHYCLV